MFSEIEGTERALRNGLNTFIVFYCPLYRKLQGGALTCGKCNQSLHRKDFMEDFEPVFGQGMINTKIFNYSYLAVLRVCVLSSSIDLSLICCLLIR